MDKVFEFVLYTLYGYFKNDKTILTETGMSVRQIFHMFYIITLIYIEKCINQYKIIYFKLLIKYPDYYLAYILTKK
jgi:hypothetical protein